MKGAIQDLRETATQAEKLQQENDLLKSDKQRLQAQNAALKEKLGHGHQQEYPAGTVAADATEGNREEAAGV